MSMHITGRELDLLESFVYECVQNLPKLPSSATTSYSQQVPPRCGTYHTTCAKMLKQVLSVLDPVSPRLCRLMAQIWDLTSLNVFVLIQLSQSAVNERDELHKKVQHVEKFYEETAAQHTQRSQRYETDIEKIRVETQQLRAELQKTRQRANRLACENVQVRGMVNGLMDINEQMGGRLMRSNDTEDDNRQQSDELIGSFQDTSATEELELFGIRSDELETVQKVDPLVSYAQDFDQLFQGLIEKEREQVSLLNEMDRFINSHVVALLWRHGTDEDEAKFVQQFMGTRTMGIQTEEDNLDGLVDDNYNDGAVEETNSQVIVKIVDEITLPDMGTVMIGSAPMVTKKHVIPASLRVQLTTRPKIQCVLKKNQLSHVLLRILIGKGDADGVLLRQKHPRTALHRFMKEFFVTRYSIVPLAEFHMMEVVKSCLYYHEKNIAELRNLQLVTDGSNVSSAISFIPHQDMSADDALVILFSRLCELVPLEWNNVSLTGGNLFACAINALVDLLGDLIELDAKLSTVHEVITGAAGGRAEVGANLTHRHRVSFRDSTDDNGSHGHKWECSLDMMLLLLSHHLSHLGRRRNELIKTRFMTFISRICGSVVPPISFTVNHFLLFFTSEWFENDHQISTKLHDTFRRHARMSHDNRPFIQHGQNPLESLRQMWRTLPDEDFTRVEMDELDNAFTSIIALRVSQDQATRRRSTLNNLPEIETQPHTRNHVPTSIQYHIGGITETEFVFHTQQVLRSQRSIHGIRTHGRPVKDFGRSICIGARGQELGADYDEVIPLAQLKPNGI